jgi:hypothetical protein
MAATFSTRAGTINSSGAGSPRTQSLDVGTGTGARMLIVAVRNSGAPTDAITSVSYAGIPMDLIQTIRGEDQHNWSLYIQVLLHTGANNLSVAFTGDGTYTALGVWGVVDGVNSAIPYGDPWTANATGSSPALSAQTCPPNGLLVGLLHHFFASANPTYTGNGTSVVASRVGGGPSPVALAWRDTDGAHSWSTGSSQIWSGFMLPVYGSASGPVWTQHPASQTVNDGANVTLTAAATSSGGTMSVKLQAYSDDLATWYDVEDATSLNETVVADAEYPTQRYRFYASDDNGFTYSNEAVITTIVVTPGPTVTTNPSNQGVVAGSNATFTAAATSSGGTLLAQWMRDTGPGFVDIVDATGTTLTLNNVTVDDNGDKIKCRFTDDNGFTDTTEAVLTVTPAPTLLWGFDLDNPAHGLVFGNIVGAFTDIGRIADTLVTVTINDPSQPMASAVHHVSSAIGLFGRLPRIEHASLENKWYKLCVETVETQISQRKIVSFYMQATQGA